MWDLYLNVFFFSFFVSLPFFGSLQYYVCYNPFLWFFSDTVQRGACPFALQMREASAELVGARPEFRVA